MKTPIIAGLFLGLAALPAAAQQQAEPPLNAYDPAKVKLIPFDGRPAVQVEVKDGRPSNFVLSYGFRKNQPVIDSVKASSVPVPYFTIYTNDTKMCKDDFGARACGDFRSVSIIPTIHDKAGYLATLNLSGPLYPVITSLKQCSCAIVRDPKLHQ